MKKVVALVSIAVLCCQVLVATNIIVSGKIVDKTDKLPIPFATVSFELQNNPQPPQGTISSNEGLFQMKGLVRGDYKVTVSYLGYQVHEQELHIGELNDIYDLGRISLTPNETALDEVKVEATRAAVSSSLDKKSFSVSNNISQTGGSVLEAMRNLPGVTINQDGKVLLRGSDKVTVLIDGKQSSLTGFGNQKGLDNIPATNIERIEIINNPSSKYDAQGMAGVVNIIYKKDLKTGWNGDVAFSYGLGEFTTKKESLPGIMDKYSWTPKYNPSISLNYRTPKVNFFVQSEGMSRTRVNGNEFKTRTYHDGTTATVNSQFLENRTQNLYNIKSGLDWYMDDHNEMTVYGLFEHEDHIDKGDVPYDYASDGSRKRLWQWSEDEQTRYLNYGLNYKHKFSQPGHKIEAVALYTSGKEDELFPFLDTSPGYSHADTTHLITKERVSSLAIDYVKPLSTGRMELGSKIQLRDIPISYQIAPNGSNTVDYQLGEWSEYREDIYAVYANYVYESKRIDIEGGVRAEEAAIRYNIDPANIYYKENASYNTLSLFPNVRFTYKLDDKNKFSLFYNKRVDRPSEFDLRPFPKYDDPEILKTGNPYLRPQYTQVYEAAYKRTWNTGSIYASLYYKRISDLFTRIYTSDPTNANVINSIPQNLAGGTNIGNEWIVEQQITKKWNLNASFNWYKNEIDAYSGETLYPQPQSFALSDSSSYTWNMKINSSLKLPKNFDIQATFVYYAPDLIPQGEIEQRYSFDFGIRKKALKDKLEFTLSVTDLFNTFNIKETIHGSNFDLREEDYYETQTIKLGVKYKF